MGVSPLFSVCMCCVITHPSAALHVSAAAPNRTHRPGSLTLRSIPGSKVIKEAWVWFISMTQIPRTEKERSAAEEDEQNKSPCTAAACQRLLLPQRLWCHYAQSVGLVLTICRSLIYFS
jgi:hypothetical protein